MSTAAHALRRGASQLQPHTDAAEPEARELLAHVLNTTTTRLYSHPETEMTAAETTHFTGLIARRAAGEPLAYILGHCGFWTLDLTITPAVLVPRPDTETLVEATLETVDAGVRQVVDLGTGSGAIALSLASERPQWQITATDASAQALTCARQNAGNLRLNVTFREGRWFDAVNSERFDVIVSNPPYVAAGDPHLDARELQHEPDVALVAGPDGLADLVHIANNAPNHLTPGGWLLLEHGYDQGPAVRALLQRSGLTNVATRNDLAGRARVTLGQMP